MQWFSGDIAAAINLAKSKSAIFVVYCEGNDENSKYLTNLINDEKVSSKLQSESFVAIRIESDKPEYIQFCSIYRLVPIPSLFFIQNGIPIKIVTNAVKSSNELLEAIEGVLKNNSESEEGNSNISVKIVKEESKENTETAKKPEIVCDGDKCYKKDTKDEQFPAPSKVDESNEIPSASSTQTTPLAKEVEETEEEKQEKIKRALKLIEEKRIERVKEEQRLEKEREIRRRQDGQEIQKLRKWQDEQEMIKLQDERKKEKIAAAEARRRVLQQIEEDKKERARRFNSTVENEEPLKKAEPVQQATTPAIPPNSARIQFKKPDGESEIVTFDSDIPFGDVHAFVKSDILSGTSVKEFILTTTFPRREFTEADFNSTLIDLNLAPSSVILIIPGKKKTISARNTESSSSSVLPTSTGGSIFEMFSNIFMGLFTPVLALFAYLKNLANRSRSNANNKESNEDYGKRKRNEENLAPNDAAKRRNMDRFNSMQNDEPSTSSQQFGAIPKSSTYKRINPSSNIHRLHQDSDDTDDEERKTYNGNSTQQM